MQNCIHACQLFCSRINLSFLTPSHPPRAHSAGGEGLLYLVKVFDGAPALCDEAPLGDVQVEHVQGMVDGLDLLHLLTPSHHHTHSQTVTIIQNSTTYVLDTYYIRRSIHLQTYSATSLNRH